MDNNIDRGTGESGIGGGREEGSGVLEGGGYAVGLGEVVVLFFGDEDVFAAAGFEFFGDEGAQKTSPPC